MVIFGQHAFVVGKIAGKFAGDQEAVAYLEEEVIVVAGYDGLGIGTGIVAEFGELVHRLFGNQRAERLVGGATFCR